MTSQQQQRYGPNSGGSQPQSYVLYPDQPLSQSSRSNHDLTPQSSFSSTSSRQYDNNGSNNNNNNYSYGGPVSRGDSGSSGVKPKQSQLSYLRTPASSQGQGQGHHGPPSPVSPSTPVSPPAPVDAITSHLSLTRLEEPVQDRVSIQSYEQARYQQARKKSISAGQQQPNFQQQQQYYPRSGELKQSSSTASGHSASSHSRDNLQGGSLRQSPSGGSAYSSSSRHMENGELKLSSSSGSATSISSSRNQYRHGNSSPGGANVDNSPSSPLSYLPVDHGDDKGPSGNRDTEKHQQKQPSTQTQDDDSDDSDSGSMLSYRRSISRLSMSYKRTPNGGVPNISLFAPGQRPTMLSQGSGASSLTESQKMIQEQREERTRQQQNSSSSPVEQHARQEESRPSMTRNNTSPSHYHAGNGNGAVNVPERSTSADSYTASGSTSRSRSHGAGRSDSSSPSMAHRQLQNQAPRPSYESTRSRTDRSNLLPSDYSHDNSSNSFTIPRSRSPGPMNNAPPTRTPGSPLPPGVSSASSGSGGGGGGGGIYRQNGYSGGLNGSSSSLPLPPSRSGTPGPGLNPHPAHHFAAGGYVRPEEAMGPSNPMPEKAEDFVRQGIDYHEVGDITKATQFFRTAAEMGDPVGMLMYGLAVRHGWGCTSNRQLAFQYLQKSAEHAVGDLKSRDSFASTAAKGELVLAIYELGICFRHGWGAEKNKKTAAYYFEIAANLDMFKAAKYYRLAAAQGVEMVGNSWIWKDKYGGVPASPAANN
ncbi:hypothetical protein BX616_006429 [Lobosporangium transversale]|nr:hypothetical protein BX616_006429 [Lobosporangium transversale]